MSTSAWRKFSRSGTQNACVEARVHRTSMQIRDFKLGEDSPVFGLSKADFAGILSMVKS